MAQRIELTLDDAAAARLAALAERAHADKDALALTLLSETLDELEQTSADMTAVLDRIPGAAERLRLGREQAVRGETVELDDL